MDYEKMWEELQDALLTECEQDAHVTREFLQNMRIIDIMDKIKTQQKRN